MILNEFKAWLDGYCDGMCGAPNDTQWSKIKKRLAEVDGEVTTKTVFVDRWQQPHGLYNKMPTYYQGGIGGDYPNASGHAVPVTNTQCYNASQTNGGFAASSYSGIATTKSCDFDSISAFKQLGEQESKVA